MDYTRSALIRSKSISELMFEQDRTFREAVSDKFKARAMGFKEKFTPMTFVRMLTGSGTIGRSIRTVAGRAMGYTERDIERFGGYKRKRSIYGPDRSRVPAGARTPAKVGDSTADILAKIYNLMRKIDEDNTRRYEEEQNFKEENEFEGRKRHGKLLESLGMKKKDAATPKTYAPEKPKEQEDESGGMLGKIFSSIFGVFGKTFKMLASLGGIIVAAVTGLFGMIKNLMGMAKSIISTVLEIVSRMLVPILEGIFKGFTSILTKILPSFATGIMGLVTTTYSAVQGLMGLLDNILTSFGQKGIALKSTLAGIALTLGISYLEDKLTSQEDRESDVRKKYRELYIGREAEQLLRQSEYHENIAKNSNSPVVKKLNENEAIKLKQQAITPAEEFHKGLKGPLKELGYEFKSIDKNGLPIYRNDKNMEPSGEDLVSANVLGKIQPTNEKSVYEQFKDKLDFKNNDIYKNITQEYDDQYNRITGIGEQFKTMMQKAMDIPSQMADEGSSYIRDALAQAGDFISHITGPTEQTIAMPAVRNTEKTFQDRIRAITYVV